MKLDRALAEEPNQKKRLASSGCSDFALRFFGSRWVEWTCDGRKLYVEDLTGRRSLKKPSGGLRMSREWTAEMM